MMSELRAGAIPISPNGKVGVITSMTGKSWVLPKGHIEKGETVQQAVLREVCEEVGVVGFISPKSEPLVTSHTQPMWFYSSDADKDKPDAERATESCDVCIVTYWYRVEVTEFLKEREDEKREVAWLTPALALTKLNFETHKSVVRQLSDGDEFSIIEEGK
jgi:8-oxo-dGTP pyrophosphatase MutT (NUDIX family)